MKRTLLSIFGLLFATQIHAQMKDLTIDIRPEAEEYLSEKLEEKIGL